MRYLALLRGINVGGNNIITMDDLRTCFSEMGFSDVQTYIQSGNVIFSAKRTPTAKLQETIARKLKKVFDYTLPVLVITESDLETVVKEAPKSFAKDKKTLLCDVLYTIPPTKPAQVTKEIPLKEGVDTMTPGKKVVYFTRDKRHASKSRLHKITQLPIYKSITIRNWNTTKTLLSKMQ